MKLAWTRVDETRPRYTAESPDFIFVMVAYPGQRPALLVQHANDLLFEGVIARKTCRSVKQAERVAQAFQNAAERGRNPKRL